jgi:hypothetical protein
MGKDDEGLNEVRAHIGSYFSYEPRGDVPGRQGAKTHLLPIRANEFGQEFVEFLTEATEVSVRRAPGFVSASLHRSTDGTKVTMYARWRSLDDYQAMRQDPAPLPFLQEALTIAKFEPGVYEVV